MNRTPTLPTFGTDVPGAGGILSGIMRGPLVKGLRQPDYALIAANVTGILMPWGEYGTTVKGCDSLTDGLANTQAMLAAKCPPAVHLSGLEIEGHKDWYLPARAELWAAYANTPELFAKSIHWTSTQLSSDLAFAQDFEHGFSRWFLKDCQRLVRPFRRIQLYHFPA